MESLYVSVSTRTHLRNDSEVYVKVQLDLRGLTSHYLNNLLKDSDLNVSKYRIHTQGPLRVSRKVVSPLGGNRGVLRVQFPIGQNEKR